MRDEPLALRVVDITVACILTALWGAGLGIIVWVLVIGGEL